MKMFKTIIYLSLLFTLGCSKEERINNSIDHNLLSTVDSYIGNSIDLFNEEIEQEGGFFMWKNYCEYLGLGEIGFKERTRQTWERTFDHKTLEIYINKQLSKDHKKVNIVIDKNISNIDNYSYILLFPFLAFATEELLLWLALILLLEIIIIPYVGRRIVAKKYDTDSFLKNIFFNALSNYSRELKIKEEVKRIRKRINMFLCLCLIFVAIFYDFNVQLNTYLKDHIKTNIYNSIVDEINDSYNDN